MANEGETTFSAAMPTEAGRGAGGKLRRQMARKPPATPYSRPPQNQAQRSRWISRIVDPAYRIIAGGATRILPYFFSKAASATALPAPDAQEQDQDELQKDLREHVVDGNLTPSLHNLESRSTEAGGTSSTANREKTNFDISTQAKGKMALNNDGGISELERLMEGRKFSRDEIDRLIDIINSRALDPPVVEREKKNLEMPLEAGAKNIAISLENGKKPIGWKETMNSDLWATSSPLPKSTIPDEVGLSPVELARAYMGGQTPTLGSKGLVSRDERDLLHGDTFAAKPFVTSSSYRPSTCWPGAKSTEPHGFATPQSQREKFGLHNFPRTPYSRTILSKSKSKLMQLQDDSSKRLNLPQYPSQRVQTPYGQFKLNTGMDANHGSVGPTRRVRHKAITETPSRVSPYSRSIGGPSQLETSEGFFPAIKKNPEAGELSNFSRSQATNGKQKSPEFGTPTVPPHSSQIARTILEHLERNRPTPKDKSAELKLATSWRRSQSSGVVGQSSLNIDTANKNGSARLNEDKGCFFFNTLPSSVPDTPSGTIDQADNAMNKTPPASNGLFGVKHATNSSGSAPLFEFGKPKDSLAKSKPEEDAVKAVASSFVAEAPSSQKPPSHSTKPVLPSISVTKPMQRWTLPSDSGAGFTFPVSSSSGVSSEPPTPSFIPSTSTPPATATSNQPEKDDEIPTFGFGTNRSSSLVFSFPSTSSMPIHEDDLSSDIKFEFGSESTHRISFSSVGKDAVCC